VAGGGSQTLITLRCIKATGICSTTVALMQRSVIKEGSGLMPDYDMIIHKSFEFVYNDMACAGMIKFAGSYPGSNCCN